jgi:mycothiol synthase
MIWPEARLNDPPRVSVAPGYTLRQFTPRDREAYFALLAAAGMDACRLEYWEAHLLPDGFFVIEHDASGALAATCMASHHPAPRHPRAGNLGWLAADPAHKGRALGRAATAAVTARLIAGGYQHIYLETHDFRIPAIKVYLQMGWVPLLYQDDMSGRWKAVCDQVGWRFAPNEWPR